MALRLKYFLRAAAAVLALTLCSCEIDIAPEEDAVNYNPAEGVEYLFSGNETLPEIHIEVSVSEWDRLLKLFDNNSQTRQNIHCDVTYVKGDEKTVVEDAALHLKGNTSRIRPEGSSGRKHVANNTNWHHFHFGLNFHKWEKDAAHELHGTRKLVMKWFHEDKTYCREIFCYDLFRRAGIWTGVNCDYCRLYLHVEGDSRETYYGVYGMYESVDENYLKVRKAEFGGSGGYLWKCRYGARLREEDTDFGTDVGGDTKHVYELKNNVAEFSAAKSQLQDFIYRLNRLEGDAFKDWISSVCDVDLLLRTYAVNVAVGMWDDYWCNKNNYYLFFRKDDVTGYKVFFIPYDYDNTLGTSQNHAYQTDSGRQNPYEWGPSSRPLIYKLLQIDEYKAIYRDELLRLIDPAECLMDYNSAVPRILEWHKRIRKYISNDTGEDMEIKDIPASWSNHLEYRVYTYGPDTWVTVKAASLHSWLD